MQYINFANLIDLLRYRGRYQAYDTAFTFLPKGETEEISITYQELDASSRAIAATLQSMDAKGERALLLYQPGLEFITAFFGCLYAGVIAVPVYPPRRNYHGNRLQAIASDAQATIALTTTSVFKNFETILKQEQELKVLRTITTDKIDTGKVEDWQPLAIDSNDLAFLQYTSGSTGTPKGVMVTHGNIIHNQQIIQTAFGHSKKSIGVNWLPLFHDMGLIGYVLQSIYVGSPTILMPPVAFLQKPIRWLKAISKYRATTSGGPNFAYDLCVKKIQPEELIDLDLSCWDLAFNGAEPVRAETLEQFGEKFADCGFSYSAFYPCYGMAETTLLTTGGEKYNSPVIYKAKAKDLEQGLVIESEISDSQSRVFVGVGHPYNNTQCIIVNPESLEVCEKEQVGEIWVSSESVASGYWNSLQATQETFQADLKDTDKRPFLRTGDLGFLSNGELFITGRLKDVIIIRGRNHYPQDIELSVEKSHKALRPNSGASFSVEVEGEEKLVVVHELERTYVRQINSEEVVEAINQAVSLEHELAIDTVVLLKPGSIPKTSSGKIQRSACRQKFIDGRLENMVLESHVNQTSQILHTKENFQVEKPLAISKLNTLIAQCISYSLQVEEDKISLVSNFYSLGIDSLKAIEIIENLKEKLNIPISPKLMYEYSTITELSQYLLEHYAIRVEGDILFIQDQAIQSESLFGIDNEIKSENDLLSHQHNNVIQNQRITGEL